MISFSSINTNKEAGLAFVQVVFVLIISSKSVTLVIFFIIPFIISFRFITIAINML